VACGLHHTLAVTWEPLHGSGDEALLTARVFGWGFGDHGRLGSGGGGGACRSPARVLLPLADNAGADTEAARGAYPCDIAAGERVVKRGRTSREVDHRERPSRAGSREVAVLQLDKSPHASR
jgi:hypothetical protein